MSDRNVARQVFISYLADDPDWPLGVVYAVASAIRDSGLAVVRLDLWNQPAGARFQSVGAWLAWMNDAVIGASHILCLVSPYYQKQWQLRSEDSKDGLALAAISVISNANQDGQNNYERIVTLRPKGYGFECIPVELVGSLSFEWTTDLNELLFWLSKRQISLFEGDSDRIDGAVASSTRLPEDLILHRLQYSSSAEADDLAATAHLSGAPATVDGPTPEVDYAAGIGEGSIVLEAHGISTPGLTPLTIEAEQEKAAAAQSKHVTPPSLGTRGMWLAEDEWRAPIGDFPPPWASAWGDDPYGLWADLTVNGATQRMRWIEPSGSEGFWMGSPQAERDAIEQDDVRNWANKYEHESRKECIDVGFWLADTPCTQAFWSAVVGENPSRFSYRHDAAERPVENVTWDAVMEQFIARFAAQPDSGMEGRLCLPNEAEWEYAARAGTRTAYWWGEAWDANRGNVDVTGNRKLSDQDATTPVQRYAPNPWGLFDVHGNVWEWCADVWRPRPDAPEARSDAEFRVVRGGSWYLHPANARAAHRDCWLRRHANLQGFRFALRSPSGPEARGGGAGR